MVTENLKGLGGVWFRSLVEANGSVPFLICLAWNLMEQSGSKKRIFLSDPKPSVPPKKKEPSGSFLPRPSPSAARMPPSRKNQVRSFFFLPLPYPLLSALSSWRRAPGGRALEAVAPRVLAPGVARLAAARWRPLRLACWLLASRAWRPRARGRALAAACWRPRAGGRCASCAGCRRRAPVYWSPWLRPAATRRKFGSSASRSGKYFNIC
ncbi:hypothetical protein GUJ93_ZPchr2171g28981 [Zizania palustris]|uniref:Uncharacterized protein n=1 Tax=Zizania palustris TaxID=103762 RepID=A0A8J5V227_ZIZPA|nr:hypothetical protein GUJ93_ZPchr2171g28981 [Zizania palustris]